MKNINSAFTPAFFEHLNPSVVEQSQPQPQPQKVSASKSTILRHPSIKKIKNMLMPQRKKINAVLPQVESSYSNLIDDIIKFVESHASAMQPPMLQKTVSEVSTHFSTLKSHLFDEQNNFFSTHKEIMFGPVKESFHLLCKLLKNQKIPLQKRMYAIVAMAPSMSVCSGGVNAALQDGISSLQHAYSGIRSASHRFKIQVINAVITDYVKVHHANCLEINEIHYGNAYFNFIANDMGVKQIQDAFIKSIEKEISDKHFAECRKKVFEKMTPSRLSALMADDYLNKVKDAVASTGVDTSAPLEGRTLTNAINTTQNVAAATLDAEFGQVPFETFLLSDPESDQYKLAKKPALIARHFMEKLRSAKLINYDNVIRLTKGDDATGDIMILDDLLWINHQGDCREMNLQALLSASPFDILNNLRNQGLDNKQCPMILQNIAQHVLDIDTVKDCDHVLAKWLNEFADIYDANTAVWDKGWITPILLLAAKVNSIETLEILINANVDLSLSNSDGQPALLVTAEHGCTAALEYLIDRGANIEATDEQGATALMHAVYYGHTEAASLLIAKKANFDAIHPAGFTSIILAIAMQKTDALQLLINAGADLEFQNNHQQSALIVAVFSGDIVSTKMLLEGGALIDTCDSQNITPAMYAAAKGDANMLSLLVEYGANLSRLNNDGKTIVEIAEEYGHADMLKEIFREKAKDNAHIISAVENDDEVKLQLLIEAGADFECRNSDSQTLTILAAKNGSIGALRTLIKANADLDQTDNNGQTALIHTAITNNIDGLKMLLNAGADPKAVDDSGTNAANHALGNFYADAFDILSKASGLFEVSTKT